MDKDSVNSEYVVGTSVYSIVFSVVPVRIVDDSKGDDSVELETVSDEIDWLFDWVTSLFVVGLEEEMAFVWTLELWSGDACTVEDEVASVTAVDVPGWLLVAYSDVNFPVIAVECIEGPPVLIGWRDDVSKIDVIMFELWSEIDDDAVVALGVICVDDAGGTEELSVEREVRLTVVVASPVTDEDVVISIEVAYECDVDNNDEYSFDIDALSVTLIVFSPILLEIAFVVAEINWVVDSSDWIDEVRSFWDVNGIVNIDVSDEIDSLFPVVPDAVERVECGDAAAVDVTTVELEFTSSSVVVGPIVFNVVPSVDMSNDEDKDMYSVEPIRFSFVVDIELDTDSVDSE